MSDSKSGKVLIACVALFWVIVGAAFYFAPHYTVNQIVDGFIQNNPDKVNQYVNYPKLRESFKAEFNASLQSDIGHDDNPFSAIGTTLAQSLADKMLDTFFTPSALKVFMSKMESEKNVDDKESKKDKEAGDSLKDFKQKMETADLSYKSFSTFQVIIDNKDVDEKPMKIILTRKIIGWEVTGVDIPLSQNGGVGSLIDNKISTPVKIKRSKSKISKATIDKKKLDKEKADYLKFIIMENFKVDDGERFGQTVPGVFGTVVNKGNKTLTEVKITVFFLDKNGTPIGEKDFYPVLVSKHRSSNKKPLKPNYREDFGYNVKDYAPSGWAKKAKVKITAIEFAS